MAKSWRDHARPIIEATLAPFKAQGISYKTKEMKKALFDAYPFGQRKYHPYKIWLDEIKRQLQGIPFGKSRPIVNDPNQSKLF